MLDRTRDHARSYHLHRLATALDTKGLHASVKTTYPAALHIFIPGATMLAESIDCTPGTDGKGRLRWYYPLRPAGGQHWPSVTGRRVRGIPARSHAGRRSRRRIPQAARV